jgi:hypothetical protein
MSSTTSALVIAAIGIAGTLASALLTQRSANNSKRQELERADQQRREEREHQAQQATIEARRACYVALNTAARLYQTELTNYLHVLNAGGSIDALHSLDDARREHRARHAEAQMIVPDNVLAAAGAVNSQLGMLYGILRRIDHGNSGTEDTAEKAEHMRAKAWDLLADMRAVMRRDLGVTT